MGGVLPYLYPPKGAGLLNRGGSWEPTPFPGRGCDVPFAFFAGGILSIEQGNDLIHALPGEVVSENAPDGIGLLFLYYYLIAKAGSTRYW